MSESARPVHGLTRQSHPTEILEALIATISNALNDVKAVDLLRKEPPTYDKHTLCIFNNLVNDLNRIGYSLQKQRGTLDKAIPEIDRLLPILERLSTISEKVGCDLLRDGENKKLVDLTNELTTARIVAEGMSPLSAEPWRTETG